MNYSPAGSSVGVTDIQQGTVNFGDTEIPMSAKDLAKAKGTVLQIPVDLGGVAISYNVAGAPKGLKLDGPTLARIFDGTITNWDSPVIAAVTGDKRLPNLAIVPVHRADSSGPGWDLDEYLIKTSPVWVPRPARRRDAFRKRPRWCAAFGTVHNTTIGSWPEPHFGRSWEPHRKREGLQVASCNQERPYAPGVVVTSAPASGSTAPAATTAGLTLSA